MANLRKVPRLLHGTLSVTAFSRASSPIGGAKGGCAAECALSYPLRHKFAMQNFRCAADVRRTSFIFKGHPSCLFPEMIRRCHIRFRQIEPLGQLPQLGVPGLERITKILSR